MLTIEEIKTFLDEDAASRLKAAAREGQRYYEGKNDILKYRMFYWNADGQLVEDTTRSNAKIPHPFFTELVDQGVQHILSGYEGIFCSDIPELQAQLDLYFNMNETFMAELSETITDQQAKGVGYMYAYNGKDGRITFENADCLGVVEVEGRFTEDGKDQYIYKYRDRVSIDGKQQWKILVIDDVNTYYYVQNDNGRIEEDKQPPTPHSVFEKDGELYTKDFGFVPFFKLENNKRRLGMLAAVKHLIDDYDLMASSLSNNLVDFDTPIHVVKGFRGDNLEELQVNLKTKKMIGVDEDGGLEVHTVDVPYQARVAKLELDEKNIYRFGMGLNLSSLKDTAATTNIAIKAAYSLLELRCNKAIIQIKKMLREMLKVVLDEINSKQGTGYKASQVWFNFSPEIMSNATENAQIALTEAQEQQTRINTMLGLATYFDNETLMQNICEILDVDYQEIKDKLPDPDDAMNQLGGAAATLEGAVVVE